MNTPLNDVIVHINEPLDEVSLVSIEQNLRQEQGVTSVGHRPGQNHLMMMVYDSDMVHASDLLRGFQERGLHAQMIGL